MAPEARLLLKRLPFAVLTTVACLALAVGATTVAMSDYLESRGQVADAAAWRRSSPTAAALEAEALAGSGKFSSAALAARRSLKASPLQATALGVLALEADAAGRPEAQTLMNRAARLNPRDSKVQAWLMQRAMLRGDNAEVLLSADNLMRRTVEARAGLSYTILPLLQDGRARQVLAARLAFDPPWRSAFLRIASQAAGDDAMAELLIAMKGTASPATDEEAGRVFQRMIAAQAYERAQSYWDRLQGATSSAPRAVVYDGGFDGLPGPPPLNWQALTAQGGGAEWRTSSDAPTGRLKVTHDGFRSSGPLVRQMVFLAPGRYEMSARASAEDTAASDRFRLEVVCATGVRLSNLPLPTRPGGWLASRKVFEIPPEHCEAQWLRISPTMVDRSEVVEMLIDDIVIKPAAGPEAQPRGEGA